MVEFLISRGALINSCKFYDITPLHIAVTRGNLKIVEILAKGANLNAINAKG